MSAGPVAGGPPVRGAVREAARDVPVAGAFDVAVVGGGVAGVAAAVAAARQGARVALVEKACALGGLATLGVVTHYLPLCDGCGRQVAGGLAGELFRLALAGGPDRLPPAWEPGGDPAGRAAVRLQAFFQPVRFLLDLERFAVEAGVDVWYDTLACRPLASEGRVRALLVENKSGRLALRAAAFVDATGDADVCAGAGEPTVSLRTNVPCGWFYYRDASGIRLQAQSHAFEASGEAPAGAAALFAGDDGADVTRQVLASRAELRRALDGLRRGSDAPVEPLVVPVMPTFRMTRRLRGAVEIAPGDAGRWPADAVGMTGDWRQRGIVYALPLAALRGTANANLLAAGRCISSAGRAWDATRAIPACVVSGEAAGTAAALAARSADGCVGALDVAELQEVLRRNGAILDPALCREAPSPVPG